MNPTSRSFQYILFLAILMSAIMLGWFSVTVTYNAQTTRNKTEVKEFNGAEQESNHTDIKGQLVLPLPDTFLKRHAQTLRSEAEMIRQKEYLHRDTSLTQGNNTDKNKKARIHFASYGNDKFAAAKERIRADANKTGWFASIHVFGPQDLPQQFQEEFEDILHMKRGGGTPLIPLILKLF
jgi:hypothetical protein